MFLLRLDMTRYGTMYTEMQNDADKGLPFPTTVHQAYTIAVNRKEYIQVSGTSFDTSSVFAYADTCSQMVDRSGRGRGKGRSERTPRDRGRGVPTDTSEKPAAEFEEYRTCSICLKKNHVKINCPDNPINRPKQAVHVVFGNLSDYDSEELDDFHQKVMVIQEVPKKRTLGAAVDKVLMFSATEVLLDNQGGRSVFQSADLLRDVSALRRPYSLSGINGASSKGLLINRAGIFRDFSRLGRSIGCSSMATVNVLSMGDCVDKGYMVRCCGVADEFTLHADHTSYVFKRKLFTTGQKSKHYVEDMADYTIHRP